MYYVLFETGNEVFFSRIVEVFSSIVVQSVVECHEHKGGGNPGVKPFNCVSFSHICCQNQECKANNRVVLTSSQLSKFEASIANANVAFLKSNNYLEKPLDRINIQKIFQNYETTNIQDVEYISLKNNQNHSEYLRSYIRKTNKLKDKAEGFIYVRAKIGSDFDYFANKTSLPNVMACDCFQHI